MKVELEIVYPQVGDVSCRMHLETLMMRETCMIKVLDGEVQTEVKDMKGMIAVKQIQTDGTQTGFMVQVRMFMKSYVEIEIKDIVEVRGNVEKKTW